MTNRPTSRREPRLKIPKVLLELFKQDNWLILTLEVARELKLTYSEIKEKMTQQELILWALYLQYDAQRKAPSNAR